MSRALRKAQRRQLQALPASIGSSSDDEEEEVVASAPNPFDLLNAAENQGLEASDDDDDIKLAKDEEEDLQEAIAASVSDTNIVKGQKKLKKKKKKTRKTQVPAAPARDVDGNDFDAVLSAHQEAIAADTAVPENEEKPFSMTELLSIDVKMLDPNVEMRKLFGSRVVSSERAEHMTMNRRNLPRGLQQQTNRGRKSVLVPMEDNYPLTIKGGLEMAMVEDEDNIKTFKFVHSRSYEQTQLYFLQCVQSGDPQTLLNLLTQAPFHVDTLLQVSEIMRQQGNNEQSEEMLTRALFAFDRAFHPRFSIASGLVRLPFEIAENRPFYLAIYRYIQLLSRRGCWATAFEFNKLLYALAPEEDPYAVLLSLDFYAIKARNWDYIERLSRCPWQQVLDDNFAKPNFDYATAVACFLSLPKGSSKEEATSRMSAAIKAFPYPVSVIFSELKATGPIQFDSLEPSNDFDRLLRDLYTFRAKDIFNTPELTQFLRDAALPVKDFTPYELPDAIPINVSRHVLILDERSLLHYLPREVSANPGMSFDPLPPEDLLPSNSDTNLPIASTSRGADSAFLDTLGQLPAIIEHALRHVLPGGGAIDPELAERFEQMSLMEWINEAQEQAAVRIRGLSSAWDNPDVDDEEDADGIDDEENDDDGDDGDDDDDDDDDPDDDGEEEEEDGIDDDEDEDEAEDEVGGFADPNEYGSDRGIHEPTQEGNVGRP